MNSRRRFVQNTSILGAALALAPSFTHGAINKIPKSTINIGLIGVGLRGTTHLSNLLKRDDVHISAICDIDASRIAIAEDLIAKASKKSPNPLEATPMIIEIYWT
ncbi:hypothetical protein GGE08_001925 [Muricauda sp. ARW1Y1]|jgi:hypothetical protein|nr:twin-arginine translocation signal domain-containing protein [Muricauda sp. ARW1Y1]NYJ27871.1 hypothetical protein [Muricauda sp. ARW1Y1]